VKEEKMKEAIQRFLDNPENKKKLRIIAGVGLALVLIIVIIRIAGGPRYADEIFIDTTAMSLTERAREIDLDAPYYNKRVRHKVVQFYRINNVRTKWLEHRKANPNYMTFVQSIAEAADYGLNPDHYGVKEIEEEFVALYENKSRTTEDVAALDMRITASFLLFTTHLIEGRIRTAGYGDFIWKRNVPQENDVKLLADNSSGKLSEIIEQLHSNHEQYQKLRDALKEYRKLERENPFRKTSIASKTIKPGTRDSSIPGIRQRLLLTDLKSYTPEDTLVYDEKMVDAVRQFQLRHGLEADGIIAPSTLKYLNQSMQHKADLIELNLERVRWLPSDFGENYIAINIPEYMLRVYENRKEEMKMRVVLGSEFNATPVFSDTLEYIVFSPTWNVPESILKEEMIPDLQTNPLAYDPERFIFYRDGEEIHPEEIDWNDEELDPATIRIVERPGQENSLGQVKFIMPNNFNIYLHDTPADQLFEKNKRAFSHGCIRLEQPVEMAKYLLRDNPEWDEEKISEAMAEDEPKTVFLKKKYPVHIDYRTVWVDENGLVHFREDIYGHDKRHLAALKRIDAI
jgi:L,D-transpeptidase YcbB